MTRLAGAYTIIIVTHNMHQAARISDHTAFLTTEIDATAFGTGGLEYDTTAQPTPDLLRG